MPEQYIAMRDKFLKKGMSSKKAKGKAARIYNSKHPDAPVGPGYDEKRKGMPPKKGKRRKPQLNRPMPK